MCISDSFHRPLIKKLNVVLYCNDVDCLYSCTSLAEDDIGNLSLINWHVEREKLRKVKFEH